MRTVQALFGLACLLVLANCQSKPATILDSDVPIVPGTEVRHSMDLVLRDGHLMGGRAICIGRIESAGDAAKSTQSRFSAAGWTQSTRNNDVDRITMTFLKDTRTATTTIEFNAIDPQMSRAVISVKPTDQSR